MENSKLIKKRSVLVSTFVLGVCIFLTDNVLMEDSTDGSGAVRVLMKILSLENEDSRDNIAQTSKETLVMLYTIDRSRCTRDDYSVADCTRYQ